MFLKMEHIPQRKLIEMDIKLLIKKSVNSLENQGRIFKNNKNNKNSNDKLNFIKCENCNLSMNDVVYKNNYFICPDCDNHLRINPRQRIELFCDENTFEELFVNLKSKDFLNFPGYAEKIKNAVDNTGENEAVVVGKCKVYGIEICIFIMNPFFIMGSMGSVVGEKITRIFEYATNNNLPVVGFCASGGARMQEGIISLIQMAKISMAIKRHSNQGNLYVSVLTDPTTGGVMASFAMEGDIIISEPNALLGFAGRRVIENTIKKRLPPSFQKAETTLKKGFIDDIVKRSEAKSYIKRILIMHGFKKESN